VAQLFRAAFNAIRNPRGFAMRRSSFITTALIAAALTTTATAAPIELAAQQFPPGDVKLLAGPYLHALELDNKFLLSLDADRLLAWYRKEAGLEPKGEVYGGWESQGIAGHSLGHYLTACALMYRHTGDDAYRDRVAYIVRELAECQDAAGDGFLGAMPNGRRIFAEVSRGDIRSQGFDLNGSWVPWYNLHKLWAGLVDAARYCDNEQAKTVVAKLSDWAIAVTQNLTDEQWQRMLACEHGGMNEALADVYAITGEQKYLDLANKFYHRAILDPLAEGRDELAGKHANTQIPKIIGAARLYELTGDEKYAAISDFFWRTVTAHHSYVTGGNSEGEHFGQPGRLDARLGIATTETCNTYNMLKLSAQLFNRQPRGEYADFMERALWNHILASRHPEHGQITYFLTLKPGAAREYKGDLDFTCCNGSGMENPPRTADYIYFHGDGQLWVNQFIASTADWKSAGVKLTQNTQFPNEQRTELVVECDQPRQFKLHLRHPQWIRGALTVTINGEPQELVSTPGGYAMIDREWKTGDKLTLELPLALRTEAMPDNLHRVAVFDGPILLAGNLTGGEADGPVPVVVTDNRPVDDWVVPGEGDDDDSDPNSPTATQLNFRLAGVGRPRDVPLLPFYLAHDMPATAYWEIFDQAAWERRRTEHEAAQLREAELAARTVDLFAIGEMQAERDHNVTGENTGPGEFNGRKLRHAWDGGWFACDLAVPADGPAEMLVDYWGSEAGGNRQFDVLVDGKLIDTTNLDMDAPDKFWVKTYPLPAELIAGKKKITVRFDAKPGNYAGGIFGIRIVRPAAEGN
jgi:DUF1680 family protein